MLHQELLHDTFLLFINMLVDMTYSYVNPFFKTIGVIDNKKERNHQKSISKLILSFFVSQLLKGL